MSQSAIALEGQSQGLRYRRLLQLGSGGMATVHLALATGRNDFSRLVVVKAVRKDNASQPEMRRMFLAEARLSARLNHPNVVQVFDVVDSGDDVMLVMEYLDGLSLSEAYKELPDGFSLPMRLRVLCDVLLGLHYAHELTDFEGNPLGIVHRDVSPANVFVTYDGRVKLLDFGIAKATTMASSDHTQEGVVKGRVAYMPSEQFSGDKTDCRADIYAVGCMIWEAVANTRMWGTATDVEILQSVWSGKLPKLEERVPDVDRTLLEIIQRATAHDPEDRHPTADALRRELEEYLGAYPRATSRDVGERLSKACEDKRRERRALIAESIAKAKSESDSESFRTLVQPIHTPEVTTTGATATTVNPAPRRGSGVWIALGLLLVAAVAVAALRFDLFSGSTEAAQASEATPPAPRTAVLTVHAEPKAARVFVDGELVSGDPATLRVDRGKHRVSVEHEGYLDDKREVEVNADMTLTVALSALDPNGTAAQPSVASDTALDSTASAANDQTSARPRPVIRRVPPVAPQPQAQPQPVARPPSKPSAPAAQCDPPYFFKGGIKTYKPECI